MDGHAGSGAIGPSGGTSSSSAGKGSSSGSGSGSNPDAGSGSVADRGCCTGSSIIWVSAGSIAYARRAPRRGDLHPRGEPDAERRPTLARARPRGPPRTAARAHPRRGSRPPGTAGRPLPSRSRSIPGRDPSSAAGGEAASPPRRRRRPGTRRPRPASRVRCSWESRHHRSNAPRCPAVPVRLLDGLVDGGLLLHLHDHRRERDDVAPSPRRASCARPGSNGRHGGSRRPGRGSRSRSRRSRTCPAPSSRRTRRRAGRSSS